MGSFHSPVAAAGCPGTSWQALLPPLSVFSSSLPVQCQAVGWYLRHVCLESLETPHRLQLKNGWS